MVMGTARANGNGSGGGNGQGNNGQASGQSGSDATQLVVSWLSRNAGLENGETYSVTLFVSGTAQRQSSVSCSPVSC